MASSRFRSFFCSSYRFDKTLYRRRAPVRGSRCSFRRIAADTEEPAAYLSWISFSDSCFMIPMGAIRQFTPVKLFVGVLVSNSKFIPEVEQRLIAAYGPIDHRSEVIPFDFTDYYEPEMGDLIDRVFFS